MVHTLFPQMTLSHRLGSRAWDTSLHCFVLFTLITLVSAGVACAADAPALAVDAVAIHAGEELFGRSCQQCHNSRGKGGKGPQLIRGAWGPGGANSDDFMRKIITGGRPGTQMGAFGSALSSDEIGQIIAFLRNESRRVKSATGSSDEDDLRW